MGEQLRPFSISEGAAGEHNNVKVWVPPILTVGDFERPNGASNSYRVLQRHPFTALLHPTPSISGNTTGDS
jgi:hypothetical protein